jgi:hypothetical protein
VLNRAQPLALRLFNIKLVCLADFEKVFSLRSFLLLLLLLLLLILFLLLLLLSSLSLLRLLLLLLPLLLLFLFIYFICFFFFFLLYFLFFLYAFRRTVSIALSPFRPSIFAQLPLVMFTPIETQRPTRAPRFPEPFFFFSSLYL